MKSDKSLHIHSNKFWERTHTFHFDVFEEGKKMSKNDAKSIVMEPHYVLFLIFHANSIWMLLFNCYCWFLLLNQFELCDDYIFVSAVFFWFVCPFHKRSSQNSVWELLYALSVECVRWFAKSYAIWLNRQYFAFNLPPFADPQKCYAIHLEFGHTHTQTHTNIIWQNTMQ